MGGCSQGWQAVPMPLNPSCPLLPVRTAEPQQEARGDLGMSVQKVRHTTEALLWAALALEVGDRLGPHFSSSLWLPKQINFCLAPDSLLLTVLSLRFYF